MVKSVKKDDFLDLQELHPYGVLPGGNRFFESSLAYRSEEIFSDSLWQQILGFCDVSTLSQIVQTSKYLYVAGHQPELWRNLVLRKCEKRKATIPKAKASWKDTYVNLFCKPKSHQDKVHNPIPIRGIYSDEYYRTHLCRSFALPSVWLHKPKENNAKRNPCSRGVSFAPTISTSNKEVPRVSFDSITPQQFFKEYEEKNIPVIIEGAGKGKAMDRWQDPSYLQQLNAKSKTFRATSGAAPLPANFTFKSYEEYCQFSYLEESPLYLFDRTAFTSNDQWNDDFFPEFYSKCPYFDPSEKHGHDLLQHLGAEQRPDHTWLIMGPKRSGSVFHLDPNATHAWNACVQGRKRWIFYPPGSNPPGVFPSKDGDEVALPLSVGEWLMQYWKEHIDQYRLRPRHERPMECTVHPGDVIFVPHGWWHMVINLDDRNIAITHNYVSPSNLGNVLKFFLEKQDQISGCRDRKESIKPELLYDKFVKVLGDKEPEHLKMALAQSTFTCRTWKDKSSSKGNSSPTSVTCKKRQLGAIGNDANEHTSVMAKAKKVDEFTFSFL